MEFNLGDDVLEALACELIEIKECTVDKDGKMLVRAGGSHAEAEMRRRETRAAPFGTPQAGIAPRLATGRF